MTQSSRRDTPASLSVSVSVVVPAHSPAPGLALCLRSLLNQTANPSLYEVVVVDNALQPGAVTRFCSAYPSVRVVHEPRSGSYAARNRGACEALGALLAFTDADCVPAPNWIEQGLAYGDRHPDVAAWAGPIVVASHAGEQERPSPSELYERVFAFPQHAYVTKLGFAATANLWCRRTTFETVGTFDPSLQSGGDYEWGQRLARSGRTLGYDATIVVHHPPRRRLKSLLRKRIRTWKGAIDTRQMATRQTIPSRVRFLLFTMKPVVPPIRAITTVLSTHRLSGARERVACAAVLLLLRGAQTVVSIRYFFHARKSTEEIRPRRN